MPVLLPFRAFTCSDQAVYIPGEEPVRPLQSDLLVQDTEPALFVYRQRFRFPRDTEDSVREGVMGVLDRAEANSIYPHERTLPERVTACVDALTAGNTDPGSLWLWCHDKTSQLAPLLHTVTPTAIQATDRFGCLHQMWRITEPILIEKIQQALAGEELFIADGHHRFAAGWNLATIQIRSKSLRSLPSHRLVPDDGLTLPRTLAIQDIDAFWAGTPPDRARFGLIQPGRELLGIEIPKELRHGLLKGFRTEPVRTIESAVEAVRSGEAKLALLVDALSVDEIEADARSGILLPPKSTDFYPKLAAGLVIYRHQNEKVTPPVPHLPGVR